MKSTKRYPAIIVFCGSALLAPIFILFLGFLIAAKEPQTGELQALIDLFPLPLVLTSAFLLLGAFAFLTIAVCRQNPVRWWVALIGTFLLTVAALAAMFVSLPNSDSFPSPSPWPPGTALLLIFGLQLLFAVAAAVTLTFMRPKNVRAEQASGLKGLQP